MAVMRRSDPSSDHQFTPAGSTGTPPKVKSSSRRDMGLTAHQGGDLGKPRWQHGPPDDPDHPRPDPPEKPMQRLTGLDATFLYMETPTMPMHVASLMILDPAELPEGWTYDDVMTVYRERLHLAPPFRRRLVEVPFELHHPLWIEDPDFDLEWHVRHIAVPPPGTRDQLETLAAQLMSIPLDRNRP